MFTSTQDRELASYALKRYILLFQKKCIFHWQVTEGDLDFGKRGKKVTAVVAIVYQISITDIKYVIPIWSILSIEHYTCLIMVCR